MNKHRYITKARDMRSKPYRVKYRRDGKTQHVGYFNTIEEAIEARDRHFEMKEAEKIKINKLKKEDIPW